MGVRLENDFVIGKDKNFDLMEKIPITDRATVLLVQSIELYLGVVNGDVTTEALVDDEQDPALTEVFRTGTTAGNSAVAGCQRREVRRRRSSASVIIRPIASCRPIMPMRTSQVLRKSP